MDKETEKYINEIVDRTVKEYLSGIEKEQLYEYADERREVIRAIKNLLPQIIQNWCLIDYSRQTGEKQDCVNHWKVELRGHLANIANLKIKGNNSKTARRSLISQVFEETESDRDVETVIGYIDAKFHKEGIEYETEEDYDAIITDWFYAIENIASLFINGTWKDISDYVRHL